MFVALFNQIFKEYDILLCPTTPIPAFDVSVDYPETIAGRAASVLTFIGFLYVFNMTGLPAASIPCGWTGDGLPIGLQIVGRRFDELTILQVAKAFEESKPWQQRKPTF
ncbi:MAG: amidase family protein [Candidatus Helarchaeales archaeon]